MFSGIRVRIQAIMMVLYIFFAGLAYGNEPIKVDYTVDITLEKVEQAVIPYYSLCVSVIETNVGRPFKASSGDSPIVCVYRIGDGKKINLAYYETFTDDMPHNILFKNGEQRMIYTVGGLDSLYDPGEYTVEVRVKHSDKVYTDTITLT